MADNTFEKELIHTVTIEKRTYNSVSKDDWNVPSETVSVDSSDVKCLIQPVRENTEIELRGKKYTIIKKGFFLITADIAIDDIVIFETKKYIVRGAEDAGGQGHHLEVFLGNLEN